MLSLNTDKNHEKETNETKENEINQKQTYKKVPNLTKKHTKKMKCNPKGRLLLRSMIRGKVVYLEQPENTQKYDHFSKINTQVNNRM